jgi:3-oxoacyl-[acyl-carrier protein] reductase
MNLHGMRCLIAGGARGLGAALALDLAGRGADLVLSYRTSAAQASETCTNVRALGRHCAALPVDLADAGEARRLVEDAARELSGLDALVYVASGPFVPQRPDELDEAAWQASIDTIAKGFFFTAQAAHRSFTSGTASHTLVNDYAGDAASPTAAHGEGEAGVRAGGAPARLPAPPRPPR